MVLTLEIIATNLVDIAAINQSKADQIELVNNLELGGLSPSLELIEAAVTLSKLPVNVMLRPHANHFIYTQSEFETILTHLTKIKLLKQPPNGIVFGSLTKHNKINEIQLQQIIENKGDLDLIFHRAFDELTNPIEGIETLNKYDAVSGLLTSGTKAKAVDGVAIIQKLVALSKSVKIMVGSGVSLQNINTLKAATGANAFHIGTAVRKNSKVNGKILMNEIDKIKAVLME